jgi:septal ring factor EnvC (AmiA/AmiB activator)
MNKFYVILPVFLLIAFGVYYTQIAQPEMAAAALAEQKRLAAVQAADDAHRKEIETKAQEDARKAQAERDAKERARLEKARLEKDEQDRKITEETAKYENEASKLSKQIADLEIEITNLRNQREETNRQSFALAKQVELAKIDRRTAEMDLQRMYEMVAQKVTDSSLAKMPPVVPPK